MRVERHVLCMLQNVHSISFGSLTLSLLVRSFLFLRTYWQHFMLYFNFYYSSFKCSNSLVIFITEILKYICFINWNKLICYFYLNGNNSSDGFFFRPQMECQTNSWSHYILIILFISLIYRNSFTSICLK